MSRSTQGPSLTTPKSSATRGDLRVLHAPTSSLLNLFMAICKDATQGEQTGRRLENGTRSEVPRYLFDSKLEACVDILSAVYFTIGTVFDKLRENVLPPLLVLRVHWLDFLIEQSDKLVYQTKLKPAEEQRWRRTYVIVKDDPFIDDRVRSGELIFLFSFISLHIFEKRPSVAPVRLADAAPEAGESQRTISHTAEVVRVTVQPVGMDGRDGTVELVPVQRRAAGTCGVDVPVVEGRPSDSLLWASDTATARSPEVASSGWRWLHLQWTSRLDN